MIIVVLLNRSPILCAVCSAHVLCGGSGQGEHSVHAELPEPLLLPALFRAAQLQMLQWSPLLTASQRFSCHEAVHLMSSCLALSPRMKPAGISRKQLKSHLRFNGLSSRPRTLQSLLTKVSHFL